MTERSAAPVSWRRRHSALLKTGAAWGAAAAAVVLVVALVAHNGSDTYGRHDSSPHARVGRTYGAFSDTEGSGGRAATLRLPSRTLRIEVTPGADNAYDPKGGSTGDIVRPPSGGRLVVITIWGGDPLLVASVTGPAPNSPDVDAATLALTADGRRYPVTSVDRTHLLDDGRVIVAVSGHPSHYGLALSLDDVTQSVDLDSGVRRSGAAEALYRPVAAVTRPCGALTINRGFRLATGAPEPACRVQLRSVPWVDGLGWTPVRSTRLLVTMRYSRPTVLERPASGVEVRYRIPQREISATATVDGRSAQPAAVSGVDALADSDLSRASFVATVPTGTAAHAVVVSDLVTVQSIDAVDTGGIGEADLVVVRRVTF